MLHGRARERGLLDELLDAIDQQAGGALLLRGESGVGKSALLADAAHRHPQLFVLKATGSRRESAVPFAHLHQLLQPLLHRLGDLPEAQADALRGALGLDGETDPDRFAVAVATLTLLSQRAGERGMLCLLDDVQRFDIESLDVVAFVARRIEREPIGILLSTTDLPGSAHVELDVNEIEISGLDRLASDSLLLERSDRDLAPEVRAALWTASQGNPLALAEMLDVLAPAQLEGTQPLPDHPGVGTALHRSLLARLDGLDSETRTLLLVAAADDSGDLGAVLRTATSMGLDEAALAPAESAAVVTVSGDRVTFRHPLMRTAVYQAAPFGQRQEVHRAIAAAVGAGDLDRRAWHLAAAAVPPDDAVASLLAEAAERARRRGGHAAASQALQRASDLTGDLPTAASRMVAAAGDAWVAGQPGRCRQLLDHADPLTTDASTRADLERLRARVESVSGNRRAALRRLLDAASTIADTDADRQSQLLVEAGHLAWSDADLRGMREVARRLDELTIPEGAHEQFSIQVLLSLGAVLAGEAERGLPLLLGVLGDLDPSDPFQLHVAGTAAMFVGNDETATDLLNRAALLLRSRGLVARLPHTLANLASLGAFSSDPATARVLAAEGSELAVETGQPQHEAACQAVLAWLAAIQGRSAECQEHAGRAIAIASRHQVRRPVALATWAKALQAIGAGQWPEALEPLSRLAELDSPDYHPMVALLPAGDLIETAHRTGRPDIAAETLRRLEEFVQQTNSPWAGAIAARSRALLADEPQKAQHFTDALELHRDSNRRFEQARTRLLLGEHLRRARRRQDARIELRQAIDELERLGAEPWAARARGELRATGETARKRDPSTLTELTPQQLQIVQLVVNGASNKDVAAQLFLSPRTVDYHLRNVFTKLGITSRAELAHVINPASS